MGKSHCIGLLIQQTITDLYWPENKSTIFIYLFIYCLTDWCLLAGPALWKRMLLNFSITSVSLVLFFHDVKFQFFPGKIIKRYYSHLLSTSSCCWQTCGSSPFKDSFPRKISFPDLPKRSLVFSRGGISIPELYIMFFPT